MLQRFEYGASGLTRLAVFGQRRQDLAKLRLLRAQHLDRIVVKKAVGSTNPRPHVNADPMRIHAGEVIGIRALVDELGLQARVCQRLARCVTRDQRGRVVLCDFDASQTHFIPIDRIESRPDGRMVVRVTPPMLRDRRDVALTR